MTHVNNDQFRFQSSFINPQQSSNKTKLNRYYRGGSNNNNNNNNNSRHHHNYSYEHEESGCSSSSGGSGGNSSTTTVRSSVSHSNLSVNQTTSNSSPSSNTSGNNRRSCAAASSYSHSSSSSSSSSFSGGAHHNQNNRKNNNNSGNRQSSTKYNVNFTLSPQPQQQQQQKRGGATPPNQNQINRNKQNNSANNNNNSSYSRGGSKSNKYMPASSNCLDEDDDDEYMYTNSKCGNETRSASPNPQQQQQQHHRRLNATNSANNMATTIMPSHNGGGSYRNLKTALNGNSAPGFVPVSGSSSATTTPTFHNYNSKNFQPPPFNPYHSSSQSKIKGAYHQTHNNGSNGNSQLQHMLSPTSTSNSTPTMATATSNNHHSQQQITPTTNRSPQEQLTDKYARKYNMISFILLRKNDEEYLVNESFYMKDQYKYERVDYLVEQLDLTALIDFFSPSSTSSDRLSNYVNSYNSSIFVYTIRKLLEKWEIATRTTTITSSPGTNSTAISAINTSNSSSGRSVKTKLVRCIKFLFSKDIRPSSYFLIDGDYPKRNVMHYAARYGCKLIGELIRESINESGEDDDQGLDRAEFVMAHLFMQPDFNGNTAIHLAAQNDSLEVLRQINPICIRSSLHIYNDEGLNTFLLACRHASLKFIRTFLDYIGNGNSANLVVVGKLMRDSRDQANVKNCLHYACGRGCGKSSLQVVSYLTHLAASIPSDLIIDNQCQRVMKSHQSLLDHLLTSNSPLVGSVYHVAASNLTRLSTLYHLLCITKTRRRDETNEVDSDMEMESSGASELAINKLDFRGFGVLDCLLDALMNLREMAPATCRSLSAYYDELLAITSTATKRRTVKRDRRRRRRNDVDSDDSDAGCRHCATHTDNDNEETADINNNNDDDGEKDKKKEIDLGRFEQLVKRCVYKLVNDFRAALFCMPRFTSKFQMLEFLKLLAFMCKLPCRVVCKTSDETNFEMFCVNFLRRFMIDGAELLNLRNNRQSSGVNTNTPPPQQQPLDTNDSDTLIDILDAFYELVSVILRSTPTSPSSSRNYHFMSRQHYQYHIFGQRHVRVKLMSMLKTYFTRLVDHFGQNSIMSSSGSSPSTTTTTTTTTSVTSPSLLLTSPSPTSSSGVVAALLNVTSQSSPDTDDDGIFSSSSTGSRGGYNRHNHHQLVVNHAAYPSIDDYIYYRSKLIDYKLKIEQLDSLVEEESSSSSSPSPCRLSKSLKDLCRDKINSILISNRSTSSSLSALSSNYIYFKLPPRYLKLVNYLTHNLIDDLYGPNFDLEKQLYVAVNNNNSNA